MIDATRILHVPRPSRVSGYFAARMSPPVIDSSLVQEVFDRYGLQADGAPRNLRLGRRCRNAVITTDGGEKVVKLYRPQWSPSTVHYGHSILVRLEEVGFPAPRLARAHDGATWTSVHDQLFGVFGFVPGTNYSLNFLLRGDRLRLTAIAGQTLARLHRCLDGFLPDGDHHLGFVSPTGARREDLAWYVAKLDELSGGYPEVTDRRARIHVDLLVGQSACLLGKIERLDRALADAPLPRMVIHGDFGLHNLIFQRGGLAVPVDFESSRLDWRLDDLISALAKYRFSRGLYDLEAMETFMRAYAAEYPLTADERHLLLDAWRFKKVRSAVRYWNSYFESGGPPEKLEKALNSINQADWVADHPQVIRRLSRAAEESSPPPRAGRRLRNPSELPAEEASHPPLNVMLVTANLEIGGAQESTRTVAKYLPRAGCRTVVCTFGDGPLRREIQQLGVPVELLPGRRHSVLVLPLFLIEMMQRRRDLLKLVAKYRADVVETQSLGIFAFLVMTLCIGRRVQVWWRIQNQEFMLRKEHLPRFKWLFGPKQSAHRRLYRIGAGMVNGIIAVSDDAARSFRDTVGVEKDKITVVLNAVDVELYPAAVSRDDVRARLGFPSGDHVMTMVGTFKRQKGHRYLVEAAASVVPRVPDLCIVFVGDGELADEIRAQVETAGIGDRIHFLGSRRDVAEILAASDSFVLPSLWEGMSVALVEAMASRLPIIATEVSGTNQVMIDGVTGRLVPPGDADALAEAMIELLANPARAATMAEAARERVAASFSAEGQAEQLAALFRRESSAHPAM